MYIRRTYDMGQYREVHNYYPGNYGAPGKPRQKRRNPTPEEVEEMNQKNRVRNVQRLILANFKPGDWHATLNYGPDQRPETFKEANHNLDLFIDAMRRECRKAGVPFKWIKVTERGKRGKILHHHLIIEDIPGMNTASLVKKLWKYGNCHMTDMYEDGEYEKLAEYIVKKETKDSEGWCNYSSSRNLVRPEPKTEKMLRRGWPQEPRPPKGWEIIKDSIRNGTNPITEYPYQYYLLRRKEEDGSRNIRRDRHKGPKKRPGPLRIRDRVHKERASHNT